MKSLLQNLRMSQKIMTAPLMVMVFMMAIAMISYRGMSSQKNALDDIFGVRFQTYQDASQMVTRMTTVNKNVYRLLGLANSGMDAAKIDALSKELLKAMGDTKAFIKSTTAKPLDPNEKTIFAGVLKELDAYEAMLTQVVQMTGADAAMAITMMNPIETRFEVLNGKLQELLAYEQKLSRQQHASAGDTFSFVVRSFFITLVVAIALSLLASLAMARLITRPLQQTVGVIHEIAGGDLTREIQLHTKDEIGDLARSVDTMRVKMGDAVGQSAATAMLLSDSATKQAASLEETSSSLEEMASMIRQSAENAAQTNELMSASQEVINMADSTVTELNSSMKEITSASEQTQKIVKTIDEIAFQTNLLALNAAVEAARAGEAGAGFAVVADEVRNLALRAAEAAGSSSHMMEDIVTKVRNGEKLVRVTYDAFRQVTASSEKVVKLMGNIVTATREQSQGIDQINRAVLDMNRITQENAASSEELASVMAMFKTDDRGAGGPKGGPQRLLAAPNKDKPAKGKTPGAAPKRPVAEQVIPFGAEGEFKDF